MKNDIKNVLFMKWIGRSEWKYLIIEEKIVEEEMMEESFVNKKKTKQCRQNWWNLIFV